MRGYLRGGLNRRERLGSGNLGEDTDPSSHGHRKLLSVSVQGCEITQFVQTQHIKCPGKGPRGRETLGEKEEEEGRADGCAECRGCTKDRIEASDGDSREAEASLLELRQRTEESPLGTKTSDMPSVWEGADGLVNWRSAGV